MESRGGVPATEAAELVRAVPGELGPALEGKVEALERRAAARGKAVTLGPGLEAKGKGRAGQALAEAASQAETAETAALRTRERVPAEPTSRRA